MHFSCGVALFIAIACCSGARARPGPFSAHAYLNTTFSVAFQTLSTASSLTDLRSDSSTTSISASSLTSVSTSVTVRTSTTTSDVSETLSGSSTTPSSTVDPLLGVQTLSSAKSSFLSSSSSSSSSLFNSTVSKSPSKTTDSVTHTYFAIIKSLSTSSASTSFSSLSTSLAITSTTSPGTIAKSSLRTLPSGSSSASNSSVSRPRITPTFSTSIFSKNNSSTITSFSTSFTSTSGSICQPTTIHAPVGSGQCVAYCFDQTSTFYSFANTTSTVTTTLTVFGNSTSHPRNASFPSTMTLPPQPCIFPGTSFLLNQTTIEPTTILITSKTTVTTVTTATLPIFVDPKTSVSRGPDRPTSSSPPPASLAVFATNPLAESATNIPESRPGFTSNPVVETSANPVPPASEVNPERTGDEGTPIQTQPPDVHTDASTPPQQKSDDGGPPNTVPVYPTDKNAPPSTVTVNGVPVGVSSTAVVIGGTTFGAGFESTIVTASGQVFTINPSQVIGPTTTIIQPTPGASGAVGSQPIATEALTPTVVDGLTIVPGTTFAVVGGSTFEVGPGAVQTTAVVGGQTISAGPGGIGLISTTILPGGNPTSPPGTPDISISALGPSSSVVVINSVTFTVGPDSKPRTTVVNGQTISIGPGGVGLGSTTIEAPLSSATTPSSGSPATSILTIGQLTLTEIGSSAVIIGTKTFTVGRQASPTTEIINGITVIIGPGGVGIGTVTILSQAPAGPTVQSVLPGGITALDIGSTLVVISGTTFTIGPSATPTTAVINGETVSFGPGGIGIDSESTTIPFNSIPTQASQTQMFTSQGITFAEIGSTLVVIGGTTFNIGPGGTPVTETLSGHTISIGPSGVAFEPTSTSPPGAGQATSTPTQTKSGSSTISPNYNCWILQLCVLLGVWALFG